MLRTLDDALTLRDRLSPGRRLVVAGAGFLGAEAAAVARKLGVRVTLLEPAPVPLAPRGRRGGRACAVRRPPAPRGGTAYRGHGLGDLEERRFVAVYRTGDRVTGAVAVGMPPKAIRRWRQAIAAGTTWQEAVPHGTPSTEAAL